MFYLFHTDFGLLYFVVMRVRLFWCRFIGVWNCFFVAMILVWVIACLLLIYGGVVLHCAGLYVPGYL